jgi:hypothetical protein
MQVSVPLELLSVSLRALRLLSMIDFSWRIQRVLSVILGPFPTHLTVVVKLRESQLSSISN